VQWKLVNLNKLKRENPQSMLRSATPCGSF